MSETFFITARQWIFGKVMFLLASVHGAEEWVFLVPGPFFGGGGVNYSGWSLTCSYWHLVAATKTCTVGKRAVRILLEYSCSCIFRKIRKSVYECISITCNSKHYCWLQTLFNPLENVCSDGWPPLLCCLIYFYCPTVSMNVLIYLRSHFAMWLPFCQCEGTFTKLCLSVSVREPLPNYAFLSVWGNLYQIMPFCQCEGTFTKLIRFSCLQTERKQTLKRKFSLVFAV